MHYDLSRPLTDSDLPSAANLTSTYGIERLQIAPSLDKIIADYDASRLSKLDVEAVLARHGLPVHLPTSAT